MLLRRSYKLWILMGFLMVMVLTTSSPASESKLEASLYAIKVDGAVIGMVAEGAVTEVEEILNMMVLDKVERVGESARLVQEITITQVSPETCGQLPVSTGRILDQLAEKIEIMTRGVAIIVGDEPIIVVADHETAEFVIDKILIDYEEQLFNIVRRERGDVRSLTISSLDFEQEVQCREGLFKPDVITDDDKAVAVLMRGTDVTLTHTVARGDTMWAIAQAYNMSVESLVDANPELTNPNLLRQGDKVNLIVPSPYINVVSTDEVTYAQRISFTTQVQYSNNMWPWERKVLQAGVSGERLITVRTTRKDGRVEHTERVEETIIKQPTPQIVVQGTRQIPSHGTGTFVWPLEGQITSRFGWRGYSFHQGVDISAPTGTPVRAADSGIVTISGWQGAYGNLIAIDHGGAAVVTHYAHLSSRLVNVGVKVEKGQIIGHVGSTGRSTGPHLHFEVRLNGTPLDPIEYYRNKVQ